MSRFLDRRLPPIDLHAHIAPDVTQEQLTQISPSLTFAVTRSLAEADEVRRRSDPGLIWGCGIHPGVPAALEAYEENTFRDLLADFVFVGEVGFDRKPTARQQQVLGSVLSVASTMSVIISLHSTSCAGAIVEILEHHQPKGAVLHWFTGSRDLVERAASVGAFFSVNSSAKDELLASLPPERVLTETDFPATRRTGSRLPADVTKIEARLAAQWGATAEEVRRSIWQNLRSLASASGTLGRFPAEVARTIIAA